MNKAEVMAQVATETGEQKAVIDAVVGTFLGVITEGLLSGDVINLRGFGKFELRLRRAVIRSNPRTSKPMVIPDTVSVTFLPSKTLKEKLNL